jgi:hypothetical protein
MGLYELRSRNERAMALSFRGGRVIGAEWLSVGPASGHEGGGDGVEGVRGEEERRRL